MPIVVVIGPSGAGKTSLVNKFLASNPGAKLHKSATTRPQRDSGDRAHDFMTDEEFDQAIADNKFIQPVEVYGHRYALPHLPSQTDQILLVLLRQQFVPLFKTGYPDAVVIQVEANLDTLIDRISKRNDGNRETPEQISQEISQGRKLADHIINNDGDINTSLEQFTNICNQL